MLSLTAIDPTSCRNSPDTSGPASWIMTRDSNWRSAILGMSREAIVALSTTMPLLPTATVNAPRLVSVKPRRPLSCTLVLSLAAPRFVSARSACVDESCGPSTALNLPPPIVRRTAPLAISRGANVQSSVDVRSKCTRIVPSSAARFGARRSDCSVNGVDASVVLTAARSVCRLAELNRSGSGPC